MGITERRLNPLSPAAVDLLLKLLDLPEPVLSGPALADFHEAGGKELIAAGLLVPDGHETVDGNREHDDTPVEVGPSDNSADLGYFNPRIGWVTVNPERLNRYRVSTLEVVARLAQRSPPRSPSVTGEREYIWDVGTRRLANRRRRVTILLLRCVADPAIWNRVKRELANQPTIGRCVLLCSPAPDRLPDDRQYGHALISLCDVLIAEGSFGLDLGVIAARLEQVTNPATAAEPLVVMGDGHEARLYGNIYRFPKGDAQRRIIVALHKRYLVGERKVPTAVIVSELDLPDRARIRDYFKHRRPPVMGQLLWEEGGLCGFCLKF